MWHVECGRGLVGAGARGVGAFAWTWFVGRICMVGVKGSGW